MRDEFRTSENKESQFFLEKRKKHKPTEKIFAKYLIKLYLLF